MLEPGRTLAAATRTWRTRRQTEASADRQAQAFILWATDEARGHRDG